MQHDGGHSLEESWRAKHIQVVALWSKGKLDEAIRELDDYIVHCEDRELQSKALACRGDIELERRNAKAAVRDYKTAHTLTSKGSYERYTLEISLGDCAESDGDAELAGSWYRTALQTVVESSERISGGLAMKRLLRLGESGQPDEAARLLRLASEISWANLELQGSPSFDNYVEIAERLRAAEKRRIGESYRGRGPSAD